ncbi:MAG: transglycosylase SLT domain-containing protein [Gammaproteobacteria bacterium]|jgi:soluble lytic murein transglycosylase
MKPSRSLSSAYPPALLLVFALMTLLACAHSGAALGSEERLQAQRVAFKKALPKAEAGDWNSVRPYLDLLQDYPLRPDLSAAWLRSSLGPETDAEVRRFLDQHPDLSFTRDLRYQWAQSLARRRAWSPFLELYDAYYREAGDTGLDCMALRGRIAAGMSDDVEQMGIRIWMSAYSRPKECDPLFEHLSEQGMLTAERRRQRIRLALEAGQIRLARYLARPLSDEDRSNIDRWVAMRTDPARELAAKSRFGNSEDDRDLVAYGFRRLARLDAPQATVLWERYDDFPMPGDYRLAIERDIALSHARRFLPGARSLIDRQAAGDPDPIVAQWRVRLAIRELDWAGALNALDGLSADEKERTIWTYWRARSLDGVGDSDAAADIYSTLAGERHYYAFLSADRLGRAYDFGHRPAEPDEAVIDSLASRADVIRTRELYMTGLYGRGRIEWRRLLDRLSDKERAQASILASRWGWYSQAIITASGTDLHDDLDLRFPTPWKESFVALSRKVSLEPSFAYGVARSESLFMSDVASGAGAVGLMQLMPATGKQTARVAGISYRGTSTLMDPESNITLGTTYLGNMLRRFGNNPVLAAAAYNAGPRRVSTWLPTEGQLPADVWIDSMPFRETRRYVRRVLESDTVFDWRMDGRHRTLSERMPPVRPDSENDGN